MKHQTLLGYDASGDAIFGTDPEALAQHKASCSAVVLDDERAAQAAQAAEYAEYLARSACDNGDSREFVKPMLDAILAASPQAKKCATCNGHGMIGGPSYYAPDEGGEPCPDCATATPYRWSESEHIIGSGNGIRDIARHIHWPECWDMATYPSLAHAVHEMILSTAFRCGNDDCKQATATQPVQTALTVWYGTDSCTCQKATATQAAQTERAARKEKS
jgi:hypothetical protein